MKGIKKLIPYIGLALIILLFGVLTQGKLLTLRNLKLVFNQAVVLIIASTGVAFVMAQGSLDLSQGSLLGITGAMTATAAALHPGLALPMALLTGFAVGLINGSLLAFLKIPSFIVTLCVLFVLRGLTVIATHAGSIPVPMEMLAFDSYDIKVTLLVLILAGAYYLFNYTQTGKGMRAIGSGEVAARYSGVPVERLKVTAYLISGTLCGLCGWLNVVRTGAADSKTGLLLELDILTALVLGGMPLTGGSGAKLQSAVVGGLMLALLGNGMVLVGIMAELQQAVKGVIFLLAVYLSFERESAVLIK
ncbi:ABC transporter permease [Candidatus Fermentibacteria bacterium]|nr:ABC transporter permease [Candidatus Fermentibacteria bacterium]